MVIFTGRKKFDMRPTLLVSAILLIANQFCFGQCELDLGTDTAYFCDGNCFPLNAGSGWTSVSWSSGETTATICPSETGWYQAWVEDGLGCSTQDSILIIRLIRHTTSSDSVVCMGQLVELNANMYAELVTAGAFYDTTHLPDGSGVNYETQILVESYAPGSVLDGNGQFLEICATMEHSYLGDLEMMLTCPNGTDAVVFNSYTGTGIGPEFAGGFGGGGTFLGQALDNGNGEHGIGWDYCFSDLAEWGTMGEEYSLGNTQQTGGPTPGTAMSSGLFHPEQPFSVFDGCPLNGLWTITVRDNIGLDDGFIMFWGLGISNDIGPVDYQWSTGQTSSQIETQISNPEVWTDMSVQGVTCSDTSHFIINPLPIINIGFDGSDCDQATGLIINNLSSSDSILLEIFNQFGIPVPNGFLDPGLYDISLTTPQGCSIDTTVEILIELDSVENIVGATVVFPSQLFTYSVPYSTCLTYAWTIDNGTIVSGQGTNEVQVTWNDSISGWIAVDMNETRDFSQTLILYVGTATGIDDFQQDGHALSYWNQSLSIAPNTTKSQLLVLNAAGQLLESQSVVGGQVVDCSNLVNGFYSAVLQSDKQQSVLKFAVTH